MVFEWVAQSRRRAGRINVFLPDAWVGQICASREQDQGEQGNQ
jgi:hypothetical protein